MNDTKPSVILEFNLEEIVTFARLKEDQIVFTDCDAIYVVAKNGHVFPLAVKDRRVRVVVEA